MTILSSLYSLSCSFGSPLDEAMTIAISIVKGSSNDIKEEREIEGDG